jgi:hypothetical protein
MKLFGFRPSFTVASLNRDNAMSKLGGSDLLQIEIAFVYVWQVGLSGLYLFFLVIRIYIFVEMRRKKILISACTTEVIAVI